MLRAGRGLANAACLFTCLLGQAEMLPDLLALGAWLEGSHAVQIARNAGKVNLILRHERGFPGGGGNSLPSHPSPAVHHHGLASSLLCALTEGSPTQADHKVAFDSTIAGENSQSQIAGGKTLLKTAVRPGPALLSSGALPPSSASPTDEACAVPGFVAVLRALRSTSLLL